MAQSEQAAKSRGRKSDQHPPAAHQESASAKLHRWFDIRQMTVAGRYTFLGIVVIFTVLLFFFIGLAIDFALKQPATMALWGIGLGSVIALIFTWRQLMKLVDTSHSSHDKHAIKLSQSEQALLEQAQLDATMSKSKTPAVTTKADSVVGAAQPSTAKTETVKDKSARTTRALHRRVGRTANRPTGHSKKANGEDKSANKHTRPNTTSPAINAEEFAKLSPEEQRILAEANMVNTTQP